MLLVSVRVEKGRPGAGERGDERGDENRGEARARGEGVPGVVASSAFQNMRPYFTDIYCPGNVFWPRESARQEKRLYTFMGVAR